jgi:hypothetical protein
MNDPSVALAVPAPETPASAKAKPDTLSLRAHRVAVAALGFAMPPLVYLSAGVWPLPKLARWQLLTSVSSYYHTSGVALFSGTVIALALFLFTYRGYKGVIADRVVGKIAGVAAFVLAISPTNPPVGLEGPPWWGKRMGDVHDVAALVLFTCLFVFAAVLFRRSNIKRRRERSRGKQWRDRASLACGVVILVSIAYAISLRNTPRSAFLAETFAIWAFALSWLIKAIGTEPRERRSRGAPTAIDRAVVAIGAAGPSPDRAGPTA